MKCFVIYLSCYKTVERTELLSRKNAIAVVAYLHKQAVAKPLYMINVKDVA